MTVLVGTIQERKDTAANWTSANPVLLDGEYGLETDTKKRKLGDGVTAWTSLAYYSDPLAEVVVNKSTDIVTDQASNTKFPSVKAVFDWAVGRFQNILTAVNFGSFSSSLTGKTTPVDADTVNISDSADSGNAKKVTWANLKAALKAYYDTFYQTILSKLTSVEIDAGTDDVKYATALGLSNSVYNPVPKTLGVIINEDFANLTNFTQTGSAFAASGGSAVVTGGSSLVFTNYIRQTAYGKSDYEKFTMSVDYTIGTISATSFGIALGLRSGGALSATAALAVGFLADSTNGGKIAFYFNNSSTGAVVSTGRMTITAGDITKIIVRRVKSTIYAHWVNITTGQTTSAVYQYHVDAAKVNPTIASLLPNAYHHTIYSLGGAATLDNFIVTCDEVMAPDYLITGASIDSGYNADVVRNRYVDLLSSATTSRFVMIAGQSDVVEDWNLTQILALQPKNIVLSIGGNNVIIPESAAATMAKVATIVSTLQGAGYVLGTTLWVCTARPRLTVDMTSLNALIRSTYPGQFIELYYPFWSGTSYTMNASFASADGAHPNVFGHKLEAMIYANFFNLKLKYDFDLNNSGINRDEQGNAGFGNNNYSGLYPVDAYSSVGSQVRFGNTYSSANRGGGTLTSVVPSQAAMFGGVYYSITGTTYVATDPAYSGVVCFGGDVLFYGGTGRTIGANVTPVGLGVIKSTGRWGLGSITSPTATMHFPAGTAAANTAPLKFTSGTNLTTPENGAFEYNGTNLFFTRAGAVRENVITTSAVNSVSPTAPNRTLTVVIDGVTYYIAAKTTND